jgi:hypothetical protein
MGAVGSVKLCSVVEVLKAELEVEEGGEVVVVSNEGV